MRHSPLNQVQLLNFAVLLTGCVMCVLGTLAPYWQEGEININVLKGSTNISGGHVVHVFGGLWWYCYSDSGPTCDLYPLGTEKDAVWVVRFFVFLNAILSVFCCLTIVCRICFQGVGRTICQGITAFIAGCCGFIVVGLFVSLFDEKQGYSLPLEHAFFSWVFFIYVIGCALVTVASLFLCFVIP